MRITDLVKVDHDFRLHRRAITLAESIQQRLQYHYKHSPNNIRHVHVSRARQILSELENHTSNIARLDRDEFISHTCYGQPLLRVPASQVLGWIFEGLTPPGPAQHDTLTQTLVEQMNEAGRNQRAGTHKTTLAYEIAYRTSLGWYMIFNTLTVAPGEYYSTFNQNSKAFQDYIRKADRLFATAAFGSIRNAHKKDYHTYFAVVEEGAKNGRLHIHVIHFFQTLPEGSEDPNKALSIPTRRELNTLKALWPHGFSSPIMVRYSPSDAYGQAGYRWPYDLRTDKPLLVNSPLALSSYMSKYITKSYSSKRRDKLLWRVKKTQKLGRHVLEELLSMLTSPQLIAVATCSSLNLKLNNQKIPPEMLRLEALRTYNKRHIQKSLKDPSSSLLRMAEKITPRPSPLQSLRGSTQSSTTNNLQNTIATLTDVSKDADTFSETWAALKRAAHIINEKYFRSSTHAFGTTSTRDHLYAAAAITAEAERSLSHGTSGP